MPALSVHPPVRIPEGKVLSEPLALEAGASELILERNAQAVVIDRSAAQALHIQLAEGARLTHYRLFVQNQPEGVDARVSVTQGRASQFTSHVFQLGAADVVHRLNVALEGEDAVCALNGLYIGTLAQRIENHTRIDHVGVRGTSRELYKGILDGEARAVFNGLVVVRQEAQKTDSAQTNKNLLLSPKAHANSTPELKILANDVKCKHGATIGQIDPAQLFYLRSRGIPQEEARKLLIYAFASEMIERVDVPALRESLGRVLFEKFPV